ncbi:hypothetical protein [Dokdonia sp. Asnod1-B02]|uniref:hypothetical protein n=1 Tax=Dokdonia sp. Asnod1-B02 TaxID=3160573 RepID=UPI003866C788
MQELQHKASRSTSGFESSTRGEGTTNNCIFRQSINKQINTGYPAKCRTRFMQWPVTNNLRKNITTILILLFAISFQANSQTVIFANGDDDRKELPKNLSEFVELKEPLTDTILVDKKRTFTIVLTSKEQSLPIMLLGYPIETYATKNNLKIPDYTNEKFLALSDEEKNKINLMIPSIEINKRIDLNNKIIIEAKITSENIERFDILIDQRVFKTFELQLN